VAKTPDQVASAILSTLSTTIPTLSCALGTPERKIIDACAEQISAAYIDQYLVGSLLDMDTKAGIELEQFVGIWGFGRLQGTAARGTVRLTLSVAATTNYAVAQSTNFYTTAPAAPSVASTSPPLFFSATQAVVLPAGDFSVDVPVQCTVVGAVGNVPPGSITSLATAIGSATCTNLQAMTGGTDPETDDELRQRFKDTFLRNVVGTADWYISMAQQNTSVTRSVVFGPTTLYTTQIAAPATALTLPVTADVKYVWPGMSSAFTNLGQEDEVFYSDADDYNLSSGASPVFTRNASGQINQGDIVDLEFQYTTASSRNDPANGVTNKVDLFVDGVYPFTVTEKTAITGETLSSSSGDPLYTGNFERVGSPGSPTATNRFTRLGNVPLVSFPPTLTIGNTVYQQGVHYFIIQDTTLLRGSRMETSGIEWDPSGPANGAELALEYVYNQVPETLDNVLLTAKQLCTDVLTHQARYTYLQLCLDVEFDRTYSTSVVSAAIANRLQGWVAGLPFGAQIKLSAITTIVTQVLGVIDCKITQQSENASFYGVQMFDNSTDTIPQTTQTADFKLADSQVAYFLNVKINRIATP
jgi:uncharacterized phage protein gp47/JayE